MVDTIHQFIDWANQVLGEQNLTQAEIAKTGIVTRQAVSALFNLQIKSVGTDMCRAFSEATGVPLITVYRQAGYLPKLTPVDAQIEEIVEILKDVTDPDIREDVMEQVKLAQRKQKRRNAAKGNNHTRQSS